MNLLPMQTTSTLPTQCWLFDSNKYYYMESGERKQLLPTLKLEYEQVLLDLGIPFRKTIDGTEYEYWQSDTYEEKELILPLYRLTNDEYRFVKYYTGKIVADSTSQAAFSLDEQVSQKITEFLENKRIEKLVHGLKRIMDGKEAIGVNHKYNPLEIYYYKEMDLISGEDHIRVFPVFALMSEASQQRWKNYCSVELFMDDDTIDTDPKLSTDYVAIFDMKKIRKDAVVELKVPHEKEGLYIGRKGWQVNEWCKKLGIKRINVIATE